MSICTTPLLLVSETEVKGKGFYSLVGEIHQQADNFSLWDKDYERRPHRTSTWSHRGQGGTDRLLEWNGC